MKIRNGFVSNSSSSSFIIVINKEKEPCPHCGRVDPNIIDLIEKSNYNNTCIDYYDKELILRNANDRVQEATEYLHKFDELDPKIKVPNWAGPSEPPSIAVKRAVWQESLDETIAFKKKIENVKNPIIQASIDYHDSNVRQFLRQMKENESIIILNEENE